MSSPWSSRAILRFMSGPASTGSGAGSEAGRLAGFACRLILPSLLGGTTSVLRGRESSNLGPGRLRSAIREPSATPNRDKGFWRGSLSFGLVVAFWTHVST